MGHLDAELRADFQQFYGINLESEACSVEHAALLLTQLPFGARVNAAVNPDSAWTLTDTLLAVIINMLTSKDAELIGPKWLTEPKGQTIDAHAMPIEQLMQELSKPRKQRG